MVVSVPIIMPVSSESCEDGLLSRDSSYMLLWQLVKLWDSAWGGVLYVRLVAGDGYLSSLFLLSVTWRM